MQPTRDTSTLDLIFTDMVEYYETPAILAQLSTSDHNVINWKSKCNAAEKGNLTNRPWTNGLNHSQMLPPSRN